MQTCCTPPPQGIDHARSPGVVLEPLGQDRRADQAQHRGSAEYWADKFYADQGGDRDTNGNTWSDLRRCSARHRSDSGRLRG